MGIQEVSRSWVHPTPPVDPKVEVPLSDLDVIQVPFHIPVLIVYRSGGVHRIGEGPPIKQTGSPPTALLKESLGRTLGAFYTLAGRIRNSSGRLNLCGFNDGVPFVEAQSDSDLPADAHLQPGQFSPDLLATPPAGVSGMPLGVPVLSVKVTRFRCGGLVLGISFHHQVADASAFFQFLSAWAAVARGASPPSPHLDRTVLIDREQRAGSGGSKDVRPRTSSSVWGSLLATWQQHTSFWRAYADLCWRSLGRKQGLFRVTFSKEEVAWLKRKANETGEESWGGSQGEGSSGDRWASSDDAVCAHMWQRITRARAFPADAVVTFDRHVDMRSRLDPPLPPDYIGSGNTGPPRMAVPAGELLGKTLGQVAQRLRWDVLRMGESYLAALFKKLKSAAFIPHFVARAPPFGTAVRVTSWAKFPLYDSDFGWGRPALVTLSMLPPFFDGVVELQQTPEEDGGLDAIVFLQEEHLQRLQADPELHPPVADCAPGL